MLKLKRFIALYIDYALSLFLVTVLGNFLISFRKDFTVNSIVGAIEILFSYWILLYKDYFFKNAGLGKKLMGIGVYDEKNQKVTDKKLLLKRNTASLAYFPFYPFMILKKNKSEGDEQYHTKVVENSVIKKKGRFN